MIKGRPHQTLRLKKTTNWKNKTCLLCRAPQTGSAIVQQGDRPKPLLEPVRPSGGGGSGGQTLQFGSLLLTALGYKCVWCETCDKDVFTSFVWLKFLTFGQSLLWGLLVVNAEWKGWITSLFFPQRKLPWTEKQQYCGHMCELVYLRLPFDWKNLMI